MLGDSHPCCSGVSDECKRAITELTGDNICTNIVYFDYGYKYFCVAMLDHNFWIVPKKIRGNTKIGLSQSDQKKVLVTLC